MLATNMNLVVIIILLSCIYHTKSMNIISVIKNDVLYHEEHNPDEYLDAPQMIRRHGYAAESHTIETEDGYLLTLHRIPSNKNGVKGKQPVFVQHGLLSSSADFLDGGNRSLGFILADAGYDVWLGNARGNLYSKAHTSLPPSSSQFWNFSWHEMGIYDLPAAIGHVANLTGQSGRILYIGHSMGTTMFFVFSSLLPEKAKMVGGMVALAPVAYMTHMTSPIRYFSPFVYDLDWLFKYLGVNEFLPKGKFLDLLSYECNMMNVAKEVCENLIFLICGFDKDEFDPDQLPVVLSHAPAGTSTKTVVHYVQEIANYGNFQMFDYGKVGNMKKYGTPTPPLYNVTKIRVPLYLMYADNDLMVSTIDVGRLLTKLKSVKGTYEVPLKKFNHVDFIWAKDVVKLVYKPLLEELAKF